MLTNNIKTILQLSAVLLLVLSTACSTTRPQPNPNSAANYNTKLGAEYLSKGRIQLANEKLSKAIEQNPNSADAHHYYALLQQHLKLPKKAQKHFKKALRIAINNPEINNNYGSFLCQQKHYAAAEGYFVTAFSDPLYKTPEYAYTNAGVCASDAGNFAKAKNYLHTALKKRANFPSALYAMAKLSYDSRQYSRAQAYLFRYTAITKNESAKSLKLCKLINTQLGEMKQADICTNKLLRSFPNSKEALQLQ
jgi:type IV pilus assembly protein PilF